MDKDESSLDAKKREETKRLIKVFNEVSSSFDREKVIYFVTGMAAAEKSYRQSEKVVQ